MGNGFSYKIKGKAGLCLEKGSLHFQNAFGKVLSGKFSARTAREKGTLAEMRAIKMHVKETLDGLHPKR